MSLKIHQFDPLIYPRLLWIVIGEKRASPLSDHFEELEDMDEATAADVTPVFDKVSKKGGVLMRFESWRAARNINYICHESTHAAMEIYDYVGGRIDPQNQEPFAYLVGWIAQCVKEALDYRKGGV